MSSNFIKITFIIILLIACKDKSYSSINPNEKTKVEANLCLDKKEKEELIKKILTLKNIKSYLHTELEERRPIRLVKESFTTNLDSFDLDFKTKIIIVDSIPRLKKI